jgi:hypothetical protein
MSCKSNDAMSNRTRNCCIMWNGQVDIIKMPEPIRLHYAKAVCHHCGKYIRWIPKPKNCSNVLTQQINSNIIGKPKF